MLNAKIAIKCYYRLSVVCSLLRPLFCRKSVVEMRFSFLNLQKVLFGELGGRNCIVTFPQACYLVNYWFSQA